MEWKNVCPTELHRRQKKWHYADDESSGYFHESERYTSTPKKKHKIYVKNISNFFSLHLASEWEKSFGDWNSSWCEHSESVSSPHRLTRIIFIRKLNHRDLKMWKKKKPRRRESSRIASRNGSLLHQPQKKSRKRAQQFEMKFSTSLLCETRRYCGKLN